LQSAVSHPHDPYVAKPEFWDLYEDVEIPMPEVEIPLDAHDPFARRVMDGIEASDVPLTAEEVARARRAYLANTSYFDSKVGAMVKALEDIGELENTLIVVTSDHGDMLGERGLWYKMSFFEHAVRVPLIVAGPGVQQGTSGNACSLVDLLPSFLEVAGGSEADLGAPIDGRSLMPLARGEPDAKDEAIAEYCAEMTPWPVYMIRRGALKYIHCAFDPPQLYDLDADPLEKTNRAGDPAYAAAVEGFAAEVATRWNCAALREEVLASQKARFVLNEAMTTGAPTHWDFTPPRDSSQEYVRNHMDWTVAAARYRFPPLKDNADG